MNKQRIVVLDTETTGLNPQEGHRIIEIGAIELINRRITGKRFHCYLNPQRAIDEGAVAVHGLSNAFLDDKPLFADIAAEFIDFIRDSELVIHNAPFDVGFINAEFSLMKPSLGAVSDYSTVFDTLVYARQKHAGQRNSLDALCKRYNVDNSHRELHGALLDAEILADVFLLMTGAQASLLDEESTQTNAQNNSQEHKRLFINRPALAVIACNAVELEAHELRLSSIEKTSGVCLWQSEEH
ncbi:MAG: DNA polymerase III subunit epsilon [Methylococcaceae bacterium]